MNKVVMIVLIVLLVVSLGGVGFLAYQYANHTATISNLDKELKQTAGELSQTKKDLSQAEQNLTQTEGELSHMKADLSNSQTELAKSQKSLEKLKEEKSAISQELVRLRYLKCGKTIPGDEVKSVSTNQGLIEILTKTVEADFGITSINTTFELLWNNSKTAKFSIVDQSRDTVEVIVSWDFNTSKITGIYNINKACVYYSN